MKKESARLRGLIGQIKAAHPARQVRLVRIVFPRWLREHPQTGSRASKYRARTTHPFDIDLGHRLDKPWSAIERMRAQAAVIPDAILKDIARMGLARGGVLLDKLEHALRGLATAAATPAARAALIDAARRIVKDHIDPPPAVPPRRVVIGKAFAFISHDVRARMDRMVDNGAQFDAIITQPPYRVAFNGKQVTATSGDGRKQPLWEPAVWARLIRPNRAICLFCDKDSLAGWTVALLEAGLVIAHVLRWPVVEAEGRSGGTEQKGERLVLVCGKGIPQRFGVDGESIGTLAQASDAMMQLIATYTAPGDHILDPFAGEGAVGMAAIASRRDYLGAEADPIEAPRTIVRLQRAYDALEAQLWAADLATETADGPDTDMALAG